MRGEDCCGGRVESIIMNDLLKCFYISVGQGNFTFVRGERNLWLRQPCQRSTKMIDSGEKCICQLAV